MNTRQKGQRAVRKAVDYARSISPGSVIIPLVQASRFATPQPFDFIWFRPGLVTVLVEVRSWAFATTVPQTRALTGLPGVSYSKQVWRIKPGEVVPKIKQWSSEKKSWLDLEEYDLAD